MEGRYYRYKYVNYVINWTLSCEQSIVRIVLLSDRNLHVTIERFFASPITSTSMQTAFLKCKKMLLNCRRLCSCKERLDTGYCLNVGRSCSWRDTRSFVAGWGSDINVIELQIQYLHITFKSKYFLSHESTEMYYLFPHKIRHVLYRNAFHSDQYSRYFLLF